MAKTETAPKTPPVPRLKAAVRKVFLAHLSETANVSASARKIEVCTASVYAARRSIPEFRAAWMVALSEGYARLEADMLCDALKSPSAGTSDAMLKSRTQKDRLRLALLAMHRTAVKSAPTPAAPVAALDAKGLKAQLLHRLQQMRSGRIAKGKAAAAGDDSGRD